MRTKLLNQREVELRERWSLFSDSGKGNREDREGRIMVTGVVGNEREREWDG